MIAPKHGRIRAGSALLSRPAQDAGPLPAFNQHKTQAPYLHQH